MQAYRCEADVIAGLEPFAREEIARGLDILELVPSEFLTQNEIDAAKTVRFDHFNVQGQQKFVWPPSFALARAYADQLERSRGLSAERIAAVRRELERAERASGAARRDALDRLAAQLSRLPALRERGVRIEGEDLGAMDWSDLGLSVDGQSVWVLPARVLGYVGLGASVHVLNGSGALIADTFVEDLLDTVTAGLAVLGGLEFEPVPGFRVYGEARYTLQSDLRYPAVRVGGTLFLPGAGGEEFAGQRLEHRADEGGAVAQAGDRDRKERDAVGEVDGAVEGVDEPAVGGAPRVGPAFLGRHRVVRELAPQDGDDRLLGREVGVGDEIVGPLEADGERRAEALPQNPGGAVGRTQGDAQQARGVHLRPPPPTGPAGAPPRRVGVGRAAAGSPRSAAGASPPRAQRRRSPRGGDRARGPLAAQRGPAC